jgi:hypothetical protein
MWKVWYGEGLATDIDEQAKVAGGGCQLVSVGVSTSGSVDGRLEGAVDVDPQVGPVVWAGRDIDSEKRRTTRCCDT